MEDIKCPNCDSTYNCSERIPLVLSCGHTFCLSCIKEQTKDKNYLFCNECKKKTQGNHNDLSVNYSVYALQLKLKEDTDDYTAHTFNDVVKFKKEKRFTIVSEKSIQDMEIQLKKKMEKKKERFLPLYNYFELMKYILKLCETENNNFFRKALNFVYKPLVLLLMVIINCFLFKNFDFGFIFSVVCILYEKGNVIKDLQKKVKLWICFSAYFILETSIKNLLPLVIGNFVPIRKLLIVIRTIMIILILGNEFTLNNIFAKIINGLFKFDLIIK